DDEDCNVIEEDIVKVLSVKVAMLTSTVERLQNELSLCKQSQAQEIAILKSEVAMLRGQVAPSTDATSGATFEVPNSLNYAQALQSNLLQKEPAKIVTIVRQEER